MVMVKNQSRIKSPPIPHEHGAWFMLYMPLIAVLVGMQANWVQALVLVLTVTGGYLAQHVAVLMLRGRADSGDRWWLVVYGGFLGLGSLVLLHLGSLLLLWLALPIVRLMSWHLVRSRFARKRIDRSLHGEMLAISGLALTAPAAYVVVVGELTLLAVGIWFLFVTFFLSSVFYVKMRIEAVRIKEGIQWRDRLLLGRSILIYHSLVGVGLVVFMSISDLGLFLLIAFAPVFVRALWGVIRLSNRLPKLVFVGLVESGYTVWFSGWVVVILRMLVI